MHNYIRTQLKYVQGLDGSLADFTLRQCNEDLPAAVSFLHDCLHADNQAAASADAQVCVFGSAMWLKGNCVQSILLFASYAQHISLFKTCVVT